MRPRMALSLAGVTGRDQLPMSPDLVVCIIYTRSETLCVACFDSQFGVITPVDMTALLCIALHHQENRRLSKTPPDVNKWR